MWHIPQNALATLRAAEWIPITAVRVLIGIFFCISGGTKLFVPSQFSTMQRTLAESHIPFPHASAFFVSLAEFACGAGPSSSAKTAKWNDVRSQASKYGFKLK